MDPGVLATITVAVLAFVIQKQISTQEITLQKEVANQEKQRAAVSRSVALYRDFVGSAAVRELRNVQHDIEHLIWKDDFRIRGKGSENNTKDNTSISVFQTEQIKEKKEKIRKSLVGVLQRLKLIYACGNFREKYEKVSKDLKTGESLCDRNTISTLLGGIILDLFYPFRPVMYCDAFFKDRYYQEGENSGYIGMWESLVIEHMRRDMTIRLLGKSYTIYRTDAERQIDITTGKIGSRDQHYSVLRLTDDRCKFYPKR